VAGRLTSTGAGEPAGAAAVEQLAAGKHGVLVGMQKSEVATTPLAEVVAGKKPLDRGCWNWREYWRSRRAFQGRVSGAIRSWMAREGTLQSRLGNRQRCETRDRHSPGEELMKRMFWFTLILTVALCGGSLPARADVVFFNDFGPGFSYMCCTGLVAFGSSFNGESFEAANLFTAAASGSVSEIDVALGVISGDGGTTVSLWSNANGSPGTELGSWSGTSTEPFGQCCSVFDDFGPGRPSLTAGQTYFVVIDPDPSTSFGWNWNNQGVTGRVEQSADGGATWGPGNIQALSAFEILGEPAACRSRLRCCSWGLDYCV